MFRSRLLLGTWLLGDVALFLLAYSLAYFIRVDWIFSTDFLFGNFITAAALTTPALLVVLATTRTFALTRKQATVRNGAYICYAAVVAVALYALTHYFLFEEFFSRFLLALAGIFSFAALWAWHIAFDALRRRVLRHSPPVFPTLIVGVTRESKELITRMNKHRNALTPVAILDGRGSKEAAVDGVPVLGKLNKLEEVLSERKITHLIQCSDLENSLNLLSACRNRGVTYMLLPSVLGIVERDERIESLEGQPVTMVSGKRRWWGWFVT